MTAPPRIDPLTAGLDGREQEPALDALLEDARQRPHAYILAPEQRQWARDTWEYLRKHQCHGPMLQAAIKALRLDEEARNARRA